MIYNYVHDDDGVYGHVVAFAKHCIIVVSMPSCTHKHTSLLIRMQSMDDDGANTEKNDSDPSEVSDTEINAIKYELRKILSDEANDDMSFGGAIIYPAKLPTRYDTCI